MSDPDLHGHRALEQQLLLHDAEASGAQILEGEAPQIDDPHRAAR